MRLLAGSTFWWQEHLQCFGRPRRSVSACRPRPSATEIAGKGGSRPARQRRRDAVPEGRGAQWDVVSLLTWRSTVPTQRLAAAPWEVRLAKCPAFFAHWKQETTYRSFWRDSQTAPKAGLT